MNCSIQFPSWPSALSFFLPLLPLLILFILRKMKNSKTLPPGPTKLPIIGNIHNLLLSGDDHIPRVFRGLANKYGPFLHMKIGHISQIIVSSSELAEQFLKTHDVNFATRPDNFAANIISYNRKDVAFAPYGVYWRQMRKVCMQTLLSFKRVKSFDGTRADENHNLVNIIAKNAATCTPVNLTSLLSTTTNNIVSRSIFGDKCIHQESFVVAMKEIFTISSGLNICDFFPFLEYFTTRLTGWRSRVLKAHNTLDNILDVIIDEHIQKTKNGVQDHKVLENGEGNLLDIVFQMQKQNEFEFEFTMTNVKSIILDMFSGGTDSAFTTVEWAMSELMKKPEAMKKATSEVRRFFTIDVTKPLNSYDHSFYTEMKYMQNVIKETLRLHPPAPLLLPHECRDDCQINGYDIEKGTRVFVNAWAIGRDPNKWEKPETFKPERFDEKSIDIKGFDFDLIPFGSGRRICPGMVYGLANVELTLATILYHFDWKMPNGMHVNDLDMIEDFKLVMGRKNPLMLVPVFPATTN